MMIKFRKFFSSIFLLSSICAYCQLCIADEKKYPNSKQNHSQSGATLKRGVAPKRLASKSMRAIKGMSLVKTKKGIYLTLDKTLRNGIHRINLKRNLTVRLATSREDTQAAKDSVKPTLRFISAPLNNTVPNGRVNLSVSVTDNSSLAFVVVFVNQKLLIRPLTGTEATISFSFDTQAVVPVNNKILISGFLIDRSFNISVDKLTLTVSSTLIETPSPIPTNPIVTATPTAVLTPTSSPSATPTVTPVATVVVTASPSPAASASPTAAPPSSSGMQRIKVSQNRRFFSREDGTPFFWLGDTAWKLFASLNRADVEFYLETRRQQGYNVIQAVALSEFTNCLSIPNAQGDVPLSGNNPATPLVTNGNNPADSAQYDYWDHVDYVVDLAASKGMYIGLLPTWGEYVSPAWSPCRAIFNTSNAYTYGRWIGARYAAKKNVIWINGGDRDGGGPAAIWRELARGIEDGYGSETLMTFHPWGGAPSSTWFHNDSWLDFNMSQSSHNVFNNANYLTINSDYNKTPIKPTLDGEPNYEDHPLFSNASQRFNDYDVRKASYWAVFAGGAGHTYGHHRIWPMCQNPGQCSGHANNDQLTWKTALQRPGGNQMQYLKRLIESRDYYTRIPDQSIITSSNTSTGGSHMRATRASDGSYAFIYTPLSVVTFEIDLTKLSGQTINAFWFNPRNGQSTSIGQFAKNGRRQFTSPQNGPDWILILDDSVKGYQNP
jgi:hypothetical protein